MNKAMIFTVTDSEHAKPIVYAQTASDKDMNDHKRAVSLIREWCDKNDVPITDVELDDAAYVMRHDGYAWHLERYCFELTEIYG